MCNDNVKAYLRSKLDGVKLSDIWSKFAIVRRSLSSCQQITEGMGGEVVTDEVEAAAKNQVRFPILTEFL